MMQKPQFRTHQEIDNHYRALGVDVDKLCRIRGLSLRKYIRTILDVCMFNGRYAFGSGNSITNYMPVKNYMIMFEEGFNWELKL